MKYLICQTLHFCCSLGTKVIGATSLEDMVSKLKKPRRVMLLVKAGAAVDSFIEKLVGKFTGLL